MPLQRHNLRVVAPAVPSGASLEELLGPPTLRPGELHESVAFEVPTVIRAAATATGTPLALAVTVVVERELALVALTETGAAFAPDILDRCARSAAVVRRASPSASRYVRELLALLHGAGQATPDHAPVVIPVRIADRLRATGYAPELRPGDIASALRWELAAVLAGQTIMEWATLAVVRAEATAPWRSANPPR